MTADGRLPELQESEFAAEADGYTATKHQHEVGTGYFDDVARVIAAVNARPRHHGSTEEEHHCEPIFVPSSTRTDSRLATLCAEEARNALRDYEARFEEITRRGRDRFLARDWRGGHDDAAERLQLYSRVLSGLTTRVRDLMGERFQARPVWRATKAVYSSLITRSIRWEIAESFFNSLTRRVFATEGVDPTIEFVDTDFDAPPNQQSEELCQRYAGAALAGVLEDALTDTGGAGFARDSWGRLEAMSAAAAERIAAVIGNCESTTPRFSVAFSTEQGAHCGLRIAAGGDTNCLVLQPGSPALLDAVRSAKRSGILLSYTAPISE